MSRLYPILLLFQALNLFGQNPVVVPVLQASKQSQAPLESCTNYAGTATDSTFIGMSNDHELNTVFLCFKDSLLIHHLGDAVLSGDPQPGTTPGVTYAFYRCPPTVTGPTLQDISAVPGPGDPCVLPANPFNGLYVTQGIPNGGDTWFFNDGFLQDVFNIGQPLRLYFATITLDNYDNTAYETAVVGTPPGPCVHANTAAAFEVVYLNEIRATGITNMFGDDCIGRFTAAGGLPEYDPNGKYTIDVSLTTNPDVKATIMTPISNMFHLSSIQFSVSEPGIYTVSMEDGKSCGKQFQIDMSGCDPFNNIVLDVGLAAGLPGETACVPIDVSNFDILSGSFSLSWNPSLLKYVGLDNFHPAIADFFNPNTDVNSAFISSGHLGVIIYNISSPGSEINILDGETLFSLCLEVLDTLESNCIPVEITNALAGVVLENSFGLTPGISTYSGGVCKTIGIKEPALTPAFRVSPNPIGCNTAELSVWSEQVTPIRSCLFNALGAGIQFQEMELQPGANRFPLSGINLSAGLYYLQLITPDGTMQTVRLVRY
ncbi:MAG TPA: hypothetical protein DCF33_08090 [Saprospirales bacterium]|nr:hypothetical protein [Saprospirales bacterium]